MDYRETFLSLKQTFNIVENKNAITGSNITIFNQEFISESCDILPGNDKYICMKHKKEFRDCHSLDNKEYFQNFHESLKVADCNIVENKKFKYSIFKKDEQNKAKNVILLFHGLNEKYWDKYLPWAKRLVELTGKTVILFPIAFHMNRAPVEWSKPKQMQIVSDERKKHFPSVVNSSFANSAISARIQMTPQRFFWSGLQTYYDVIQLVKEIRDDKNKLIDKDAGIDFFAYSIGSFLAEILLMANHENLFLDSKLFIFCGGPTIDRMYPVSKHILDSDANIAMYSFFIEHLENEFIKDNRLSHYFNDDHQAGKYFKAMLSYQKMKEFRQNRLMQLKDQIAAIALKKDEVIPPIEVLNILKGDYREIPIEVKVLDFPFDYTHVNPFPNKADISDSINKSFNEVFELASAHLS